MLRCAMQWEVPGALCAVLCCANLMCFMVHASLMLMCVCVCRYALTKLCNLWFVRHLAHAVLPAAGGKVVAHVVTPGFIPNTGEGVLGDMLWVL
jgi:hypothetical protein